ncbi:MAG: phosphate ABC transporter substrate-binding protein PstS [Leptospirales bacterium]
MMASHRFRTPSQQEKRSHLALSLAGLFVGLFAFFQPVSDSLAATPLTLSGSSMMESLEKAWSRSYVREHPDVRLGITANGSGEGIRDAGAGNVDIGVSDAYLTSNLHQKYPNLIAIPVAIGDAQIIYNLPGVPKNAILNMDGPTLANILNGSIRYWDDPSLKALNPGLDLPHLSIIPVHRSDLSGTTFVLTDYLSLTSHEWSDTIGRDRRPKGLSGIGVPGSWAVVRRVRATPGALGYVGLSWGRKSRLPSMALKNRDGFFVVPSPRTIQNAALGAFVRPDFPYGFNRSIVWKIAGKQSYPASNFEYFLVNTNIDSQTMGEIRRFLLWILGPGQDPSYTVRNGFASLPYPRSQKAVSRILEKLLRGNSFLVVSPG